MYGNAFYVAWQAACGHLLKSLREHWDRFENRVDPCSDLRRAERGAGRYEHEDSGTLERRTLMRRRGLELVWHGKRTRARLTAVYGERSKILFYALWIS